jgi:beta-phosphoglucomutase-like phosphatase (HAD superfamily)
MRDAGLRCAVVSGSTNARVVLERARLTSLIHECIDGNVAASDHLSRKPSPDMHLAACRRLEIDPAHAALFETAHDGVLAGRAGGFAVVIVVEQEGKAVALKAAGADAVVADLGEMLEHALGSTGPVAPARGPRSSP